VYIKSLHIIIVIILCQLFALQLCNGLGVLPDGSYNKNTKVEYCCRNDGSAERPIQLPSSAPFYLYKMDDICQEV